MPKLKIYEIGTRSMKIGFLRFTDVACNYDTIRSKPVGATESVMIYVAHYLAKLGHQVRIFNASPDGVFGGVRYTRLAGLESFSRLAEPENPYDAFIYVGCDGSLNSRLDDVPAKVKIMWAHNDWCASESYERYDAIVCVSNSHRLHYAAYNFFRKTYFIHNGVDEAYFPPTLLGLRKKKQAIYIGVIVVSKGFHLILQAWDRITSMAPGATLVVAGSAAIYGERPLGKLGIAEPEYEERFIRPHVLTPDGNLREDIKFLGALNHPSLGPAVAESLVALVNPSRQNIETCCAAAIEAQACGTAVVGVNAGALPEVIRHGHTGLIVDSRSDDAYAKGVASLLNDCDYAVRLGRNGRQFVTANFLYSRQARKWETLLSCLLEKRPVPSCFTQNWYSPPRARHTLYSALRVTGQGYRAKRWKQVLNSFARVRSGA